MADDFVTNQDLVRATTCSIIGCCRSIAAHNITHKELKNLELIYDQLLSLMENIQKNGLREHDPTLCGCEYKGCDMWSCGHIDGGII
jgi:hypothetical protein